MEGEAEEEVAVLLLVAQRTGAVLVAVAPVRSASLMQRFLVPQNMCMSATVVRAG